MQGMEKERRYKFRSEDRILTQVILATNRVNNEVAPVKIVRFRCLGAPETLIASWSGFLDWMATAKKEKDGLKIDEEWEALDQMVAAHLGPTEPLDPVRAPFSDMKPMHLKMSGLI